MQSLDPEIVLAAVRPALAEDLGGGDVTSMATIPADARLRAVLRAREPMVVAGLAVAEVAFHELSPAVQCRTAIDDGARIEKTGVLMEIEGPARAVLGAERVALNFVQRLSGIATLTARFVAAVQGTKARILDTRKTTPGLRRLEKHAVLCGGGTNHRMGLFDMVLIKDNHLAALRGAKPNAVAAAVQRARAGYPRLKVEVEADTVEQVAQAVEAGADIVLLDNMTLENLRASVALAAGRCQTEASGGVNLDTVRAIAETGVDFISVGALTHGAPSVDIGLDFLE